jgi:hypothetical protein
MGCLLSAVLAAACPFPQAAHTFQIRVPPPPNGRFVISGKPIVRKPARVCAIPLLNALHGKTWDLDRMAISPPPSPSWFRDIVVPPAPSCDDAK